MTSSVVQATQQGVQVRLNRPFDVYANLTPQIGHIRVRIECIFSFSDICVVESESLT